MENDIALQKNHIKATDLDLSIVDKTPKKDGLHHKSDSAGKVDALRLAPLDTVM